MNLQPKGTARINWANPLTRGLVYCTVGTDRRNLVNNVAPYSTTGDWLLNYKNDTISLGGVGTQKNQDLHYIGNYGNTFTVANFGFGGAGGEFHHLIDDDDFTFTGRRFQFRWEYAAGITFIGFGTGGQVVGLNVSGDITVPHLTVGTMSSTGEMGVWYNKTKVTGSLGAPNYSGDTISKGHWRSNYGAAWPLKGTIAGQWMWNRGLSDAEILSLNENPWQIFEPTRKQIAVNIISAGSNTVSGTFTNSVGTITGTVTTINTVSGAVTNSIGTIAGSVVSKNTVNATLNNTVGTLSGTIVSKNSVSGTISNIISTLSGTVTTINTVNGTVSNSQNIVTGTVSTNNAVNGSISNAIGVVTGTVSTNNAVNGSISNFIGVVTGSITTRNLVSGSASSSIDTLSGTVTTINPVTGSVSNAIGTLSGNVASIVAGTVTGSVSNTKNIFAGSVVTINNASGTISNTKNTLSSTVTTINIVAGTISNSQNSVSGSVSTKNIIVGSVTSQPGVLQGLINTINIVSGSVSGNLNIFTYTTPMVIPVNQFRKFTTIQLHGIEITKVLIKPTLN